MNNKAEFFSEIANAPKAIGPYSVVSRLKVSEQSELYFCSGQIALVPETGQIVSDDVLEQAQQIFKNIDAILNNFSLKKESILKVTVFLTDMNDFAEFNKIYTLWMGSAKPARSTVTVAALPAKARIEIEITAHS